MGSLAFPSGNFPGALKRKNPTRVSLFVERTSNFTSYTSEKCTDVERADLLEDEIGDRGVGIDDDGGHFVITDLLQQRRRVQVVIQHPD